MNDKGYIESDYLGIESGTISGFTCQDWTAQSPHVHSYTADEYPNKGIGNYNYCRNPGGDSDADCAWCYTTNANKRWEYCTCPTGIYKVY